MLERINFAISVLAAVSFFRFAAPLSYRRIFSFANSTTQPKVICLVQDVTAEHICNRLDANMLHTCSAVSDYNFCCV